VGNGILDEAAACLEFFAVVGGFGGEGAVLEFFRLYEVIVHAYLGPDGQGKK